MSQCVVTEGLINKLSLYLIPEQEKKKERESLTKKIQQVVNCYCFGGIGSTWINWSLWNETTKEMKPFAMELILNHFYLLVTKDELEKKADLLSTFLLRYTITKINLLKQQHNQPTDSYLPALTTMINNLWQGTQYFVDQNDWVNEKIEKLSLEEITDRAIKGNGTRLPKLTSDEIISLIKLEKDKIETKLIKIRIHMSKGINSLLQKEMDHLIEEVESYSNQIFPAHLKLCTDQEYLTAILNDTRKKRIKLDESAQAFMESVNYDDLIPFGAKRLAYWIDKIEVISEEEDTVDIHAFLAEYEQFWESLNLIQKLPKAHQDKFVDDLFNKISKLREFYESRVAICHRN